MSDAAWVMLASAAGMAAGAAFMYGIVIPVLDRWMDKL